MKIAIITYAFYESTVPLFKYLSNNHSVDLYCLFNDSFLNPPSFDISHQKDSIFTNAYAPNNIIPDEIINYVGKEKSKSINIYIRKTSFFDVFITDKTVTKDISSGNYDILHFINYSDLYLPIIKKSMQNTKVVFSLHESNLNRASGFKLNIKSIIKTIRNKRAEKSLSYSKSFLFFSENERNKFQSKFIDIKVPNYVVKFGLFETFNSFYYKETIVTEESYYLYVGYIRPYKGVDFLLDSIKKFPELRRLGFVIAGKDDMGLSSSCCLENVTFYNKFLTDQEFVDLIRNAKAVILPYQEASQSGIPCVALTFNIPLIFSNIKGLNEYLLDGLNGVSFDVNNQQQLKQAILKMENKEYYSELKNKISIVHFKEDHSWNSIAVKVERVYDSIK